jgi:hydroxysqualene synthase
VGRLLLGLYGVDDPVALRRSDAVCSALQLINFWQDFSRDGPNGRLYVPQSDLDRHDVNADDVLGCRDSPAARALVRDLCGWARALMLEGAPLALTLPGRAGWELRLVVQGGLAILDKIAARNFDSLVHRPKLGAWDLPRMAWRALTMRASP